MFCVNLHKILCLYSKGFHSKVLCEHEKMLTSPGHQGTASQNHNEIPPHTRKGDYKKHPRKQQMLARMWRNCNPHALLKGIENGTAIMENSLDIPQKIKYSITI